MPFILLRRGPTSDRRAQLRHAEWVLDHLPPGPAQEVGNARLLGLGGYEDDAGDDGRPVPGNLVVFSGRPRLRQMTFVFQKVDAARTEHFTGLRASAKREAEQIRVQEAARKRPPPPTRRPT